MGSGEIPGAITSEREAFQAVSNIFDSLPEGCLGYNREKGLDDGTKIIIRKSTEGFEIEVNHRETTKVEFKITESGLEQVSVKGVDINIGGLVIPRNKDKMAVGVWGIEDSILKSDFRQQGAVVVVDWLAGIAKGKYSPPPIFMNPTKPAEQVIIS